MTRRNIIAVVLVVISLVVVVPGLIQPIITLSANMAGRQVFTQTRSILQTVKDLHESGNDLVAGMILLFSVLVPFIKAVLLGVMGLLKPTVPLRYRIFAFVRGISKWAMADVFVVGVYIAYLSAKATDALDAELHEGFYYFTAYCLISLISVQVMHVEPSQGPQTGDA
jgi:paraquat-inducible protein A